MSAVSWADFAARNRVPLWPGLWNRWQLLTSGLPEGATAEQAARALIGVMSEWCGGLVRGSQLEPALQWTGTRPTGAADELRLRSVGSYADIPDLAVTSASLMLPEHRRQGAKLNRMDIPGPFPRVESGHVSKLVCSFVWRSTAETMPWPIWRDSALGWGNLQPMAPQTWLLDRVLEPSFGAPAEETLLSELLMPAGEAILESTNPIANATEAAAGEAVENVKLTLRVGAILVTAALATYVVALPRMRR